MSAAPLPELFRNLDVHTHAPSHGAIVNLYSGDTLPADADYFSVGIHPWYADRAQPGDREVIENMAADPRVVAIGECGLDRRNGPGLEVQMPVFISQIELSERVGKPLIIHAVGTFSEVLALKKSMRPDQPWIIHGFIAKETLAQQLASAGIYLSLPLKAKGLHEERRKHLEHLAKVLPRELILTESDEQL